MMSDGQQGACFPPSFFILHPFFLTAAGIAVFLTVAARATRTVDWSGAVSGGVVAFLLHSAFGWAGTMQLMSFFALGTLSSEIGRSVKKRSGTAQTVRTWRNAAANAGVGGLCGLGALILPDWTGWAVAAGASFAAAASDTVSGEIGRVYGTSPRMITTFRPARTGENGAVTAVGTLAGIGAALVLAGIGYGSRLLPDFKTCCVVAVAGIVGNLIDSLLGATLERRGALDNEGVNFCCTFSAAVLAALCCKGFDFPR